MNQTFVSVKYIGVRPEYIDGAYGTRIHFVKGESRLVPEEKARLMLKHKDVYEPGDDDSKVLVVDDVPKKDDDEMQDMRDAINVMDKDALSVYAITHFSVKLDKRREVGSLRSQVTSLVDQYGLR